MPVWYERECFRGWSCSALVVILCIYRRTPGCEIKVTLPVYVLVPSILRVSGWRQLAGHRGVCHCVWTAVFPELSGRFWKSPLGIVIPSWISGLGCLCLLLYSILVQQGLLFYVFFLYIFQFGVDIFKGFWICSWGFPMRFDFLSKSPLLIRVVYSFEGVFMNTHSESITVLQYTDYAREATLARFSFTLALAVR